jgi:16S rRNA processing protein RimM
MSATDRHLVVGRFRKPHGLKGEVAIFPLTAEGEKVFAVGQSLWIVGLDGEVIGGPLEVERSRPYHREWLMKFRGVDERIQLDAFRGQFVGVPADTLAPPAEGEVYLHELEGFVVQRPDGSPLGLVSGFYELPGGLTLEIQGPKREFLLPFRKEFVLELDRTARRMVVQPPEGLVEESE